ncbi:hypothetical protein B0T10DRAFT_455198 [Thelonectria olida]|uniref:Uncharacterized protein n=1 Tax=Thelonectria olida TaxID=1576542 RepID=A0A9P8WFD3_9HYPO|nr:hypothetical protein B0T10DRAFT_455198 [Thelonectria olida]
MKVLHTLFALCLSTTTTTALPTTCTTEDVSHLTPSSSAIPAATPTALVQARQPQQSIPPYTAIVTAAPTQDEALASLGYYQTTYYECRTRDGHEHCGWHIPVRKLDSGVGRREVSAWHVVAAFGAVGWVVM